MKVLSVPGNAYGSNSGYSRPQSGNVLIQTVLRVRIASDIGYLSNTEVDFVLLKDFRPINIKAPKPVIKQPVIKQPIQLANGVKEVNLSWTDIDVTVDGYDYTHTVKLTTQGIVTINTSASTESIIEIAIDSTLTNGTIESATLVIYEP